MRVSSFSRFSSSLRATSHSSRDTTSGRLMVVSSRQCIGVEELEAAFARNSSRASCASDEFRPQRGSTGLMSATEAYLTTRDAQLLELARDGAERAFADLVAPTRS